METRKIKDLTVKVEEIEVDKTQHTWNFSTMVKFVASEH